MNSKQIIAAAAVAVLSSAAFGYTPLTMVDLDFSAGTVGTNVGQSFAIWGSTPMTIRSDWTGGTYAGVQTAATPYVSPSGWGAQHPASEILINQNNTLQSGYVFVYQAALVADKVAPDAGIYSLGPATITIEDNKSWGTYYPTVGTVGTAADPGASMAVQGSLVNQSKADVNYGYTGFPAGNAAADVFRSATATPADLVAPTNYTFVYQASPTGKTVITGKGANGSYGYATAQAFSTTTNGVVMQVCNNFTPDGTWITATGATAANARLGLKSFSLKQYRSADYSLDGQVDLNDASALLTTWGAQSGANFTQGDSNGDNKVDLDDASVLLSQWGTATDTAAGTAKGSVNLADGSVSVDVKGIALWKIFIGDANHAAAAGTLLSYDAGKSAFPGFAVTGTTATKQVMDGNSFGAFATMNTISTGTAVLAYDDVTGDLIGVASYGASISKDTLVNVDVAGLIAGGKHLWLQYQTVGNAPLFTELTVPEPTALSLMGIVVTGLMARRRNA